MHCRQVLVERQDHRIRSYAPPTAVHLKQSLHKHVDAVADTLSKKTSSGALFLLCYYYSLCEDDKREGQEGKREREKGRREIREKDDREERCTREGVKEKRRYSREEVIEEKEKQEERK